MAEEKKSQKEAFVSSEDRPDVKIDLDKPITELKVRDLSAILGHFHLKKVEFKEWKEKPEFKELKHEKLEKFENLEKHQKVEKLEFKELKPEFKELKSEKLEFEPVKHVGDVFEMPDPRVFEQVHEIVREIGTRVDRLQDQVNELRKKLG